jgi:hypothetical protein
MAFFYTTAIGCCTFSWTAGYSFSVVGWASASAVSSVLALSPSFLVSAKFHWSPYLALRF